MKQPEIEKDDRLLSAEEVCEKYKVSKSWLQHNGKNLLRRRLGRRWLYPESSILQTFK